MSGQPAQRTVTREVIQTHREVVVRQVAYTVADVQVFLGMSKDAVLRLIRSGALRARANGRRYIIPGAALIEFLDGADEPMHHRHSA
jgi:excisionase family DNA binding protein